MSDQKPPTSPPIIPNLIAFYLNPGTVVHYRGLPFYLSERANFLGTEGNSKLAAEADAADAKRKAEELPE